MGIRRYRDSSELVTAIRHGSFPEISTLIGQGYGTEVDPADLQQAAIDEYNFPGRASAFIHLNESGKVDGSLSAIRWMNTDSDKRGRLLREFLTLNGFRSSMDGLSPDSVLAYDVGGIVVAPDSRGKGIARELIHASIEELDPTFVIGQTKNPSAVIARSKALAELGYVSVYGGQVIRPRDTYAPLIEEKIGMLLNEAFYHSRAGAFNRRGQNNVTHLVDPHLVPLSEVSTEEITDPRLKKALEAVNVTQREAIDMSEKLVAFSPFVAVKKEFLDELLSSES